MLIGNDVRNHNRFNRDGKKIKYKAEYHVYPCKMRKRTLHTPFKTTKIWQRNHIVAIPSICRMFDCLWLHLPTCPFFHFSTPPPPPTKTHTETKKEKEKERSKWFWDKRSQETTRILKKLGIVACLRGKSSLCYNL